MLYIIKMIAPLRFRDLVRFEIRKSAVSTSGFSPRLERVAQGCNAKLEENIFQSDTYRDD